MVTSPNALDRVAVLTLICEYLSLGATKKNAAAKAGISRETLHAWSRESSDVSDAIIRAEAQYLASVELKLGLDATEGSDWRARIEVLKRRDRDQWGDKLDLGGLPDNMIRELLGANRGMPTIESYPSAPKALLSKKEGSEE